MGQTASKTLNTLNLSERRKGRSCGTASGSALRSVFWTLALGIGFVLGPDAHADIYQRLLQNRYTEKGTFEISPYLTYFTTNQNFNINGEQELPNATFLEYRRIGIDLGLSFGLTEELTVFAHIVGIRADVQDNTAGEADNPGLQDQTIGAQYRLPKLGKLTLDVEARMELPMYSNQDARTDGVPYLGDGTTDITGAVHAIYPIFDTKEKRFLIKGGAGFTFRSDDFSSHIPYYGMVELSRKLEGLHLEGGFAGFFSLETDPTSIPGTIDTAPAGGSLAANAINPSLFYLAGKFGYRFSKKTAVYATIAYTLFGTYAPGGTTIALGVELRPFDREPIRSPQKRMIKKRGANKGFINYDLEARVTRVNDRLNFVQVDKGADDGIKIGESFDIFRVKKSGKIIEAIARGVVTAVKSNEAILKISEYYKEVWINEGFVAKRPIQ